MQPFVQKIKPRALTEYRYWYDRVRCWQAVGYWENTIKNSYFFATLGHNDARPQTRRTHKYRIIHATLIIVREDCTFCFYNAREYTINARTHVTWSLDARLGDVLTALCYSNVLLSSGYFFFFQHSFGTAEPERVGR